MCGAALVANVRPAGQTSAQAAAPVAAPPVAAVPKQAPAERHPAPLPASDRAREAGPIITGPSFLGLNTQGSPADRHADGGRDALRPSSNLDYLLEDEEQPSRGLGKLILIVAALALMVGFGYLHWKQGGFDWLNVGEKKAAAVKPAAGAAPTGADSGSATAANPDGTAAATGAGAAAGTGGAAGGPAASPADSG